MCRVRARGRVQWSGSGSGITLSATALRRRHSADASEPHPTLTPTLKEKQHMAISVPKGYLMAGVHCRIKRDPQKQDLTLVMSETPASAAGRLHAEPGLRRARRAGPQPHAERPDSRRGDLFGRGQRLHRRARAARRRGDGPSCRGRLRGRARPSAGSFNRRDRLVLADGQGGPGDFGRGGQAGPQRSVADRGRPRHVDHRHHPQAGRPRR